MTFSLFAAIAVSGRPYPQTDLTLFAYTHVEQSDIAVTTNKFSYVKQSHLLFCLKRWLLQPISDFQCLSHP